MIRPHEKPIAWRAGMFSLLVHVVLLAVMLISFNWKTVSPSNIAQVELWDNLPTAEPAKKPVPPKPEPKPEPVPEPKPKPLPPPPKPEPKPEPAPEPEADIQLKQEAQKRKEEEKKRLAAEKLKEEEKRKLEEKKRKEEEKRKVEEKRKQDQQRKLEELQKMIADENKAQQQERQTAATNSAASAASAGEVDKYVGLISSKIRRNVNKQLCGPGKPELTFAIALMPTGDVIGSPRIIKSSGIAACDQAVERAILQAQPLPVPDQPDLFAQFRDLQLRFRPNDEN